MAQDFDRIVIGADVPAVAHRLAVAPSCGATKRHIDRKVAVHATAAGHSC